MRKQLRFLCLAVIVCMLSVSCKEKYSVGEKVGTLTEFAQSGLLWDSWDGRLNLTQTGMNTAGEPFEFSFDNDRNDQDSLITRLQKAQVEISLLRELPLRIFLMLKSRMEKCLLLRLLLFTGQTALMYMPLPFIRGK